jgi:hypothetical protein
LQESGSNIDVLIPDGAAAVKVLSLAKSQIANLAFCIPKFLAKICAIWGIGPLQLFLGVV